MIKKKKIRCLNNNNLSGLIRESIGNLTNLIVLFVNITFILKTNIKIKMYIILEISMRII